MVGIGENAGVTDIGDGWAVTFKVESTTTPRAWSPTRVLRPVWAVLCVTLFPWVHARLL